MQNQQRQWTSVSGGSDNQQWNPKATEKNGFQYNPQGNNAVEGYYSKFSEIKGLSGLFCVYEVTMVNPDGSLGQAIDLTGDTVLDDKMAKIEVGTYIRIEYKGRAMKKGYPAQAWSQTNSYHIWEVLEDKGAIKLHQLVGVNPSGNPAVNAPIQNNAPVNNFNQQTQPQFNQGQPQFNQAAPKFNNGQQQGNFQQQWNFNNAPPVNGNFGGSQQGINPMPGQGNPFAENDQDPPF